MKAYIQIVGTPAKGWLGLNCKRRKNMSADENLGIITHEKEYLNLKFKKIRPAYSHAHKPGSKINGL